VHIQATLQYALCLAVADNTDEGQRVRAPVLRTSATVRLRRLLIDEGPQMLLLATDAAVADELTSADPKTSESVQDFVLGPGETSTI
jgi:hypothetical protein